MGAAAAGAMRVTLGYLLTAAGLGHMCLGALLFFNASMMQTGNLLFVPGVVLTFGVRDAGDVRHGGKQAGHRRLRCRAPADPLRLLLCRFWLQCYAIFLLLTGN